MSGASRYCLLICSHAGVDRMWKFQENLTKLGICFETLSIFYLLQHDYIPITIWEGIERAMCSGTSKFGWEVHRVSTWTGIAMSTITDVVCTGDTSPPPELILLILLVISSTLALKRLNSWIVETCCPPPIFDRRMLILSKQDCEKKRDRLIEQTARLGAQTSWRQRGLTWIPSALQILPTSKHFLLPQWGDGYQ